MRAATLKLPQTKDDVTLLQGGMDQMTPSLSLQPGACRRSLNFEAAINGGYTRIAGYERYSGKVSPSSATFQILNVLGCNVQLGVGTVLQGSSSGATGKIIVSVPNTPLGPTVYCAITQVSAPGFVEGEFIEISGGGPVVGRVGPQTISISKSLKKQYLNLAADVYRAAIAAPSLIVGAIRGIFGYTDKSGVFAIYVFFDRDAGAGHGLESDMAKSTPTGWQSLPIHNSEVEFFSAGPVPIAEGVVYDYFGTSVRIIRVIHQGGSWEAQTAYGLMIVNTSGPFHPLFSPYTVGGTTFVTKYAAVGQRWHPGGSYEFVLGNFGGQLSTSRIYGCDGVNRAFEFDGETIVPIATGIETYPVTISGVFTSADRPSHIAIHQNHLFLSIGSSYFHSGPGTPYNFTAGAGGGENATGDTVTGFSVLPGVQASGALAVMGRNHTKILYGTALAGPEPFDLVNFETETGAVPRTIQKLDRVYYLDDRGVIDLKTAQEYGNFTSATLTRYIQKFIDQKHTRAACSTIHRGKGQYRVFFNDGTALFVTLDNGKLRGAMPVAFPIPMFCAWSGEDNLGQEVGFAGGANGMVYQLDRGTSFDGSAIEFEFLLNWNTMKSPRQRKTIHRVSVEIQDTDYTEIRVGARLGPEITAHLQDVLTTIPTDNELAMQWDHFSWDNFWWDAHNDAPLELDVKGTAERVQYILGGSSDYLDPFTVSSIITHYIPRRGLR